MVMDVGFVCIGLGLWCTVGRFFVWSAAVLYLPAILLADCTARCPSLSFHDVLQKAVLYCALVCKSYGSVNTPRYPRMTNTCSALV